MKPKMKLPPFADMLSTNLKESVKAGKKNHAKSLERALQAKKK